MSRRSLAFVFALLCIIAVTLVFAGSLLEREAFTPADWMVPLPATCAEFGCNCRFGYDASGCKAGRGCKRWNGSTVHPTTGTDLSANVSLACGNVGAPNALHSDWNESWLADTTRQPRGFHCTAQSNGYGCRSGLCLRDLNTDASDDEPVSFQCA
jgi:hypothetical protein